MAVDHNNPQSRDEEILIATIDGTEYNKLPQSRMEELLLELKEVIEEGGSGGGGIRPIGVTTTPLYDGATTNPIQINGESYTAETGDMVTYQSTEFLFNVNEVWQELGDMSIVLAIIDNIFADIAPAFDTTDTYAVDDYVIYNDQLYRCTTAHTGAWDENDFTATTISDEIADVSDAVKEIKDGTVIDSFADVETALADKVSKVNGKDLSTNDYDDTEKAAVAAATSAISAMKDGSGIDSFGDVEIALLDKADISDLGTAAAKDSTNSVTAGSTDLVESGAVKDAIDAAVSSAYHHAGTKTVAQLTHDLLIAANEGNVYNITDSGTTTSDFIEGIGKTIDEGSNVGICKVGNVYMFDLLSGFVDTSNFVQKSITAGLLKNDGTVNTTIENAVDANTTAISGIKDGQRINSFGDVEDWTDADAKTVTGNPITISDAAAVKAKALSMSIEPVQDLHGYDKPWVGGAGKNKLPLVLADLKTINTIGTWSGNAYTGNGVTFTVNTDNDGNVVGILVNGTATGGNANFYLVTQGTSKLSAAGFVDNTDYLINGCPANGSDYTYRLQVESNSVWRIDKGTGSSFTYTSGGQDTVRIQIIDNYAIPSDGLLFKPMIRLATEADATFAPYTNICPITGHTEASVQRDGKNLWRGKFVNTNFEEYSTYNDGPSYAKAVHAGSANMQVFPGQTYRYSVDGTAMEMRYIVFDNDDNIIVPFTTSYYITIPNNGTRMKWRSIDNVGSQDVKAQLEIGEVATPYVPYVAQQTYTILFKDAQGQTITVFGSDLDVKNGTLKVGRVSVDMGTLTYSYDDTYHRFVTNSLTNIKQTTQRTLSMVCECYDVIDDGRAFADVPPFAIYNGNDVVTVYIHDSRYTNPSDLATALDGMQLVYPLATPTTIQLTPQQIQLLKGQNTLTANGATISLTYQPDNLVGEVMEQVEPQIDDLQGQIDEIELPSNPSADGSNLLLATTESGETTKSWIAKSSFLASAGAKIVDCNNEKDNAIIRVNDGSTNIPTGATDGILIVFRPVAASNVCVQLYVESGGNSHIRTYWYTEWKSWKSL